MPPTHPSLAVPRFPKRAHYRPVDTEVAEFREVTPFQAIY